MLQMYIQKAGGQKNPPAARFNIPLSFGKLGIACGTQEYLASVQLKHLDDSQVYYEATIGWKAMADTEEQNTEVNVGIPGKSQGLGLSFYLSPQQRFSHEHLGQLHIHSHETAVSQRSFEHLYALTCSTSKSWARSAREYMYLLPCGCLKRELQGFMESSRQELILIKGEGWRGRDPVELGRERQGCFVYREKHSQGSEVHVRNPE